MIQPHTYLLTALGGDYEALERELFDAIRGGALPASDICIRDETAIGGFRSIRDSPGVCAQIRNGWISDGRRGKTYVRYLIEPAPFREWLKSTGRWPLPEGHALSEWLDVPKTSPHVTERRGALEELLLEIERRAKEMGVRYIRAEHPGNSKALWQFIRKRNPDLAARLPTSPERFKDDLHAAGIRFLPGNQTANGGKFYRELFPEVQ